ncbi:hypothetical protein ACH42_13315 [Endozoicomonas sp. (ex Bugula neritina AB1)]|nr:hypothetical protein ACH42_13315 [Endozoicomonas sp. (ex Bugula neritina AB1)]
MIDADLLTVLLPAFAAGLIVLSTHLILGRQVLQRGIVFIDLAVAQVASLGVIISHHLMAGAEDATIAHHLFPIALSLSASLIIAWLSHYLEHELEAIIGCIYVLAAAAVLIILAHNPYGSEQIERSLAGRIFWVTGVDLVIPAIVSLIFLLLVFLFPHILYNWMFYPLFAVLITLSVDLVGVYLVFSTLIMPSLATYKIPKRRAISLACLLGAMGYGLGLLISHELDFPGGAVIVVVLALICILFRISHYYLTKDLSKK